MFTETPEIALRRREPKRERHPWIFRGEIARPVRETGFVRVPEGDLGFHRAGATLAVRVFRGLRDLGDLTPWLAQRIGNAVRKRPPQTTARVFYGEADGVSGLVIDRYLGPAGSVAVIQLQNAAAETLRPHLPEALDALDDTGSTLGETVVLRLDSRSRAKDQLRVEPYEILRRQEKHSDEVLRRYPATLRRGPAPPVTLEADLLEGQKTGLFLDQVDNAFTAAEFVSRALARHPAPLRVLDLFCYVGLWSSAFASRLPCEATGLDRSENALERYTRNTAAAGATEVHTVRDDFFQSLSASYGTAQLKGQQFDVVVCDPPALIQARSDLERGKPQYQKAFAFAHSLVKPEGFLILSSCSQLLDAEDFDELLPRGFRVWQGQQSSDHPMPEFFPEAAYLKCVILRIPPKP